jgi:hypothetical protein
MHLTLSPQVGLPGQPETTIRVAGDVLTMDGTAYDLSAVPEGGEGWPDGGTPFIPPIRRVSGAIHAAIIARLGDTAASDQPDSPWIIPDAEGEVTIPATRRPAQEDVE